MGVILESVIKSVVLKFEGRSKNIANKNINPLDKPNKIPKNLSKPDALDHITILLINFIKSLPKKINKVKTTIYEMILDTSLFWTNSFIVGVARYSRLIAAMNAANHKNNDKNSVVKPLEKEIIPEAINTTKINQSA